MTPPAIVPRLAVCAAFLLASADAAATRPRPIDCAKAQAIEIGWSGRQVTRALGKPYSIRFARDAMDYGWVSRDGADRLTIRFDVGERDVDARRVIAVDGTCSGTTIALSAAAPSPAIGHAAIAQLPRSIMFDGTPLHLAYVADAPEQKMRFAEYLPAGQSLATWRQMIAVFVHRDGSTPSSQLDQAERIAEQTRNPHFRQVHLASDGSEAAAAFPMLRDDAVEYQLPLWRAAENGVTGLVYFSRLYQQEGRDPEAWIADEHARIDARLSALRALPAIVPPDLGGTASLTLTTDGTANGEVVVPAQGGDTH